MLTHWCKPSEIGLWSVIDRPGTLGERLDVLTSATQTTEHYKVALLGTDENADEIRKILYGLADHFPQLPILDLGNLRKPKPDFAIALLKELRDARIIPVWIGGVDSLAAAAVSAYQRRERTVTFGTLHPAAGYSPAGKAELPPVGIHRTAMAFQAHQTPLSHLNELREAEAELMRLGEMRTHLDQAEPLLRNLDLLCLHAGVVREADLPAQCLPGGVGLTLEETCQAVHYAGLSDRLSCLTVDGWQAEKDTDGRSARALAAVIWYFLDGIARRQGDFPASKQHMTEYVVNAADTTELTFWKSERSGRWWVEVNDERQDPVRKHLLACNYVDYTALTEGTFTPFLLRLLGRFV